MRNADVDKGKSTKLLFGDINEKIHKIFSAYISYI